MVKCPVCGGRLVVPRPSYAEQIASCAMSAMGDETMVSVRFMRHVVEWCKMDEDSKQLREKHAEEKKSLPRGAGV